VRLVEPVLLDLTSSRREQRQISLKSTASKLNACPQPILPISVLVDLVEWAVLAEVHRMAHQVVVQPSSKVTKPHRPLGLKL
jgi:hypothetical protein